MSLCIVRIQAGGLAPLGMAGQAQADGEPSPPHLRSARERVRATREPFSAYDNPGPCSSFWGRGGGEKQEKSENFLQSCPSHPARRVSPPPRPPPLQPVGYISGESLFYRVHAAPLGGQRKDGKGGGNGRRPLTCARGAPKGRPSLDMRGSWPGGKVWRLGEKQGNFPRQPSVPWAVRLVLSTSPPSPATHCMC